MRLGIIVGHTAASGGAKGLGIDQEYFYNKKMAEDMRAYALSKYSSGANKMEVKIFFRDDGGVPGAYGRADAWKANYTAELHYNSVGNSSVRGTETLSSGSSKSLVFAKNVQDAHCSILGRSGNSRGIKIRNRQNKDRGWFSLVAGNAPAIITEPAFGSSVADANLLKSKQFELGRAIVDSMHKLSA
ncbi:MAG: N-acetylmuramoyl-L-alanine amidase [Pseudomonadota bacterium]